MKNQKSKRKMLLQDQEKAIEILSGKAKWITRSQAEWMIDCVITEIGDRFDMYMGDIRHQLTAGIIEEVFDNNYHPDRSPSQRLQDRWKQFPSLYGRNKHKSKK